MDNLLCENEFCIYQFEGKCILETVRLDIQGSCLDCVYIDIDKDVLNSLKEKNSGEL